MRRKLQADPNLWFHRPIPADLVAYAVADVAFLLRAQDALAEELDAPTGYAVLEASKAWTAYAFLNQHLVGDADAERRGVRLQAMLTAASPKALHFKLNCRKVGVVSRPEEMEHFGGGKVGDVFDCQVVSWNTERTILFLERIR